MKAEICAKMESRITISTYGSLVGSRSIHRSSHHDDRMTTPLPSLCLLLLPLRLGQWYVRHDCIIMCFMMPFKSVPLSLVSFFKSQLIVNPRPFLADLTGKTVRVKLKWGTEYQGTLSSSDAYMNLLLERTEEFIDGQFAGFLGQVLIRCNNVLYIKAAAVEDAQMAEPTQH